VGVSLTAPDFVVAAVGEAVTEPMVVVTELPRLGGGVRSVGVLLVLKKVSQTDLATRGRWIGRELK
jgi:hypothetical protein